MIFSLNVLKGVSSKGDMFSVFSNKKPTEYIKTLQDCAGSEFTRLLLAGPPEEPLYMLKPEVIPFLKWINRKILFELPYIKTARDVKYIDIRIRIATNMFLNTYEQKGILSKDICITYHNRLTERVRKIIGYIYTEDLPF